MNKRESRKEKGFREHYEQLSDLELFRESHQFIPSDVRSYMATQILNERRESAEEAKEEREVARHNEIQKKLEDLKKPHSASFWLLVASVTLAFVAAVAAILSVPQLQKVFSENLRSQTQKEQLQTNEPKSETSKPNKAKK